ncbi:ABC transporter permease subunit [Cellulomonas sp. JZ18]|uniref:ABC transporter permease subunit n=1 Tax=Cellulomonas sp. JZ18 TaxID=2654191 RepID=UPI0012D456A5|nr:ABC transporter permease subunit [Cellulomonas sp. JZ18]QGQ20127.1 ABC transporter permease subunit [Cellulomonas sp. JZ18]
MTAPTTTPPARAAAAPASHRSGQSAARVTFPRVVHAEWVKLWTLRSTYWTLGVALVVLVGFALIGAISVREFPEQLGDAADGSAALVSILLQPGLIIGPLAFVVLAALTVTGEYATGAIRSSLAAVPARLPILAAKALVVAVVVFLATAIGTGLALLVGAAVVPELAPDWGAPEVVRVVLGGPLYVTALALFALAAGALLRNTAATVSLVIGLVLVVENALNAIPWEPLEYVRPLLPSTAGISVASTEAQIEAAGQMFPRAFEISPWGGYGILLGWVVVLFVAAAVRLRTRDA